MRPPAKETVSRREFFRSSARYGWLLALGAALAWQTSRRDSSTCSSTLPCVTCPAFNDCGLPPALTAREDTNQPAALSAGSNSTQSTSSTP